MKLTTDNQQETKSEFFLLPLVSIPKSYFNNASAVFALNEHNLDLTKHVFVVFEKDKLTCFELERFQTFKTYHNHEYIGEFVLLTFALPKEFHKDYKRFLKGKYSKFSDEAKIAISHHTAFKIKNEKGKYEDSKIFKILYPNKLDRYELADKLGVNLEENCEIMSSPDLEKETFNINRFYKLFK
jgi:hypothetical protein